MNIKITDFVKTPVESQIKELLKSRPFFYGLTLTEISNALDKNKGNLSKSLKRLYANDEIVKTNNKEYFVYDPECLKITMDDDSKIDLLDKLIGEHKHEIYCDVYRIPANIDPEMVDEYCDTVLTHNHPVEFIY